MPSEISSTGDRRDDPLSGDPFSTDAWRSGGAAVWEQHADRLELMIEPVLLPVFDAAALVPGEAVLDVGCGRGATTHEAARRVGIDGKVIGVDVAANLIDAAAAVPGHGDSAPIDWVVGDAQRIDLGVGRFDVVISRFGVMFFDDPTVAFANLARATRPGGRLAMATWRPRDASVFQSAWYDTAVGALEAAGHEVERADPTAGPFSFGVDEVVVDTLEAAGWTDVELRTHRLHLLYGGPGTSPPEALELALAMPGVRSVIDPFGDDGYAVVSPALMELFGSHDSSEGVAFDAAISIVTARLSRESARGGAP